MAAWAWSAAAYAVWMAGVAVLQRPRRWKTAVPASIVYAVAAIGVAGHVARTVDAPVFDVMVPGAFVLGGYWLSDLFVGQPQAWLEARLLDWDRSLFTRLSIDRLLRMTPLWVLNAIELSYSSVYVVVMAGAVAMAFLGREAVLGYWAVVVPAELVCYGALPFLRTRPPRSLEPPGVIAMRSPALRRLNDRIVRTGSIQVNTIPSGHVAGATAAGLAASASWPAVGLLLIVSALLIAVAATVGRYHYAIDCVLGAAVAFLVWSL